MVLNTLTRSKVRFIPRDGKNVLWYQCGVTVYAESHMGHARTYVALDILRRIMKEYLGYNVLVCQNVTDVDDKIIIRSSERSIPFRELAERYENEFNQDMASLGCALPDITPRVSEYVDQIIAYIEKLVEKGIAYESNGSVYFSTGDFEAQGHKYGKLMPEQIGNSQLLAEGEGSLTASGEKRAPSDFALWKKSKDHTEDGVVEPFWPSPWGNGRPGWHIECSVMSHECFKTFGGGNMDVHAGGTDLKFPHHENEIAQSEAYTGSKQWVNYWLHTGHVHIEGMKMSKSLKNFITIREALTRFTSRQIRICFLLHKYNAPMDYGEETMQHAVNTGKIFSEFFHNCKALLRRYGPVSSSPQHIGASEEAILARLQSATAAVREALLDDFDTPKAMAVLLDLVRDGNKYMETPSPAVVSTTVLTSVAKYITFILHCFGCVPDACDIGFPLDDGEGGAAGVSKEDVLAPLLDVLTKFRASIRVAALSGDTKAVLTLNDQLRDDVLPELGVRMEDKGSGENASTVWKLENPETLRKEREQKEEARLAKEAEKNEAKKRAAEREERAKVPPSEMFRDQTAQYSAFDEQGVPTHDAAGEALSKNVLKRLQKEFAKQTQDHEKYLTKQQKA